jgi:heptaprenyl diphosphate synthase
MAKQVARVGVFVALAMIFSYIEVLIPFHFGIPGVKLGVANIVTVTALYLFGWKEVFLISFIRIFLMGVLFGNGVSLIYSLAGGLLSLIIMVSLKKTGLFSVMSVSVAGGIFHNIGQIIAASLVLQSGSLLYYYLPILFVAGIFTGCVVGMLANRILQSIEVKGLSF